MPSLDALRLSFKHQALLDTRREAMILRGMIGRLQRPTSSLETVSYLWQGVVTWRTNASSMQVRTHGATIIEIQRCL